HTDKSTIGINDVWELLRGRITCLIARHNVCRRINQSAEHDGGRQLRRMAITINHCTGTATVKHSTGKLSDGCSTVGSFVVCDACECPDDAGVTLTVLNILIQSANTTIKSIDDIVALSCTSCSRRVVVQILSEETINNTVVSI